MVALKDLPRDEAGRIVVSEDRLQAFWRSVDKTDGCWEWMGPRSPHNYGHFVGMSAHKFSYLLHHGAVPAGMVVRHLCSNRPCVNPAHLTIGTYADNARDSIEAGRWSHQMRSPPGITRPSGYVPRITYRPSDSEIFWRRVVTSGECWLWQGGKQRSGHGRFTSQDRVSWTAHRFAYYDTFGPIPEGLVVMHMCDNPPCVRPDHLRLGTPKDNTQDMMRKGRNRFPEGSKSPLARLSEPEVIALRGDFLDGMTPTELALKYGVAQRTIYPILRGRTWRHVVDEETVGRMTALLDKGKRGGGYSRTRATNAQIRETVRRHAQGVSTPNRPGTP